MSAVPKLNDESAPRFQPEVVAEFLNAMFPDRPRQIVAIKDDFPVEARYYLASEETQLLAWVEKMVIANWNIYFAVNPLKERLAKKAQKADVLRSDFFFVDIDPRAGEPPHSERDRILRRLKTFRLPPTFIIDSGGGYQAIWRLSDPLPVDGEGPLTAHVEDIGAALELELGADNCRNIERILRLPGTVNYPNEKKRKKGRLVSQTQLTVSNPSLTYLASEFPSPKVTVLSPAPVAAPVHIESLSQLGPYELPAWVLAHVEFGDDETKLNEMHNAEGWPRAGNPYPSRSEALFAAVTEMVRKGIPDATIVGILLDPRFGISASVLDKRQSVKYANKQVKDARDEVFGEMAASFGWPDLGPKGRILPTYKNARVALAGLGIVAHHDVFRRRLVMGGQMIGDFAGDVTDYTITMLRDLLIREVGVDFTKRHVTDAAIALCVANPVNPVADYLDGLTWDGVSRIDTWLSTYMGVEDTPLTRVIGRKVLLAGVRRVRQPGIKFDTVLVLEGTQGAGKSQALKILATEMYFSDATIFGQQGREQQEAVAGIWIYELAELAGHRKASREMTKAFISRTHDRARPAYGNHPVDQPRTCIFIGSTNDDEYLQDPTGNRRFWPVKVGQIDLEALRRDRDQLWAEAAAPLNAAEPLVLPKELYEAAGEQQAARVISHPWEDKLAGVTGHLMPSGDEYRVWNSELFSDAVLGIPMRDRTPAIGTQVASIMRKLGWTGPVKLRIRKGENPQMGYSRQATCLPDEGSKDPKLLDQPEIPF